MKPRRNLRRRTEAPLPAEKAAAMPVVYDPATSRLITNWPTHNEMSVEQQRQLRDALDQIAEFGDVLRMACWIFPDGRAPVPVAAADLRHWLVRHEFGRAVYITRRAARRVA